MAYSLNFLLQFEFLIHCFIIVSLLQFLLFLNLHFIIPFLHFVIHFIILFVFLFILLFSFSQDFQFYHIIPLKITQFSN